MSFWWKTTLEKTCRMRAVINMSNAATDDAMVKWIDLELTERNRWREREKERGSEKTINVNKYTINILMMNERQR